MDTELFNAMFDKCLEVATKGMDLYSKTARSQVGCCIVGESGKMYTGLNVGWWHSTCAEPVALSNAWQGGERTIKYVMCVKIHKVDKKVLPVSPCGICREMFCQLQPEIQFVLAKKRGEYMVKTLGKMMPCADELDNYDWEK